MLVNSGTHSGEIVKDSPGTWHAVLRNSRLSPERIAAAYRLAASHGGLAERAVRGVGVSFNPRAARVLNLRLQYHPALTESEAVMTLLASAVEPVEYNDPLLSADTGALAQFLPIARGLLGLEPLGTPQVSPQLPPGLIVTHLLDAVRHLHLWSGGIQERQNIAHFGRTVESNSAFADEPLVPLLRTALGQQERLSEETPSQYDRT